MNATKGTQIWDSISDARRNRNATTCISNVRLRRRGCPRECGDLFLYSKILRSSTPIQRTRTYAYNGATGAQIWNISGEFKIYMAADGILIGANNYDNTVFAFGHGPTATTVTAPQLRLQLEPAL